VFEGSEDLEAMRFGDARAADYRLELPIAPLKPGAYLLRLEATLGEMTSSRDVRFVVACAGC
jgi:hypothetical protein